MLVKVHANQALTPPLRRIGRQQSVRWGRGAARQDQGRAGRCPVRTRRSPTRTTDSRRVRPQTTGRSRRSRPRLSRIRGVSIGQPERAVGSNRVRVADSAKEPVPGLATADRAAHRITPSLGRNGISHHAHSLVMPGRPFPRPRLTATATATAATTCEQQRPTTAHDARTIRANSGYARPEKPSRRGEKAFQAGGHGASSHARNIHDPEYARNGLGRWGDK